MNCSSAANLSLFHSTTNPPNSSGTKQGQGLLRRAKTLSVHRPDLQKPISFPSQTQPSSPHSPFLSLRVPSFPKTSCSGSPENPTAPQASITFLFKSLAEKVAVLVFGSVLFMGIFRCKPVLSVPGIQTTPLEEKVETEEARDEGEDAYVKIVEKNPRDVEALKMVLYGKMRKGKTAEAVKYVERLIDVEPDEVEWRLLQALSYELMGQLGKAKRLFKEILEERPLLLRALHGLALVMHKNHEGPAVFEMLNKALEIARHEQRVIEERNIQILIAQMHVVKGDFQGGLKRFQDLVNENPKDFRPFLCQGIIYSLLDKKKEADEQFEIYQALVPEEFPQRGFLDDVILAAKMESQEQLKKEFDSEFSYKK